MKKNTYVWLGAVFIGAALTLFALQKKSTSSTEQPQEEETMEFVTRPDGLKYHIEKHGSGETTPEPGQVVEVHYTGWLDDGGQEGEKFDSSVDRGQPFSFVAGAGQVIKGWDETLLEMREGEVRYIILPPDLAYGNQAVGSIIPANATLRFRVELLNIVS